MAQRLLPHEPDRAFRLVVSDRWLAGLLAHADPGQARRLRDGASSASQRAGLPRRVADRHRLPQQRPCRERPGRPARGRAANRPSLPVAAAAAGALAVRSRTCSRRSTITRFDLIVIGQPFPLEGEPGIGDLLRVHVLPSDPVNDAELARAQIPPAAVVLSVLVLTAMLAFAGRVWRLAPFDATCRSGCTYALTQRLRLWRSAPPTVRWRRRSSGRWRRSISMRTRSPALRNGLAPPCPRMVSTVRCSAMHV